MDYKVGDKVRVKEWDELREEFGVDENGKLNCSVGFISSHDHGFGMSKFMGKVVTIEDVLDDEDEGEVYYTLKEDELKYYWEKMMLSPVEVERGGC